MRVLYLAPFATHDFSSRYGERHPAGIAGTRKMSLIAEALALHGHEVVILSSVMLSNSKVAWRAPFYEQLHYATGVVNVVYPSALMLRPFGGLLNCIRAPSIVRKVLKEFIPDAVIVYNTYLFESLATRDVVRLAKVPIILEIEDLPLARRRGWFNVKPWLDQRSWSKMLELSVGFTAVNGFILDQLPKDKPKFLLPGVIDRRLEIQSRNRTEPFSRYERTVGYFGGLAAEKGVRVLLDLVPRLPPEWRLVVSGSGPLVNEFEALGKQYPDRMTFLGRVDETQLYEAMCGCDCTVIPLEQIVGQSNGVFPFKTLEYIAAGTHVIASRLAPLKDLDLGFVQRWDGNSAESLLEHLSRAETDFKREQTIREQTIASIFDRYSMSGVVKLFSALLSIG